MFLSLQQIKTTCEQYANQFLASYTPKYHNVITCTDGVVQHLFQWFSVIPRYVFNQDFVSSRDALGTEREAITLVTQFKYVQPHQCLALDKWHQEKLVWFGSAEDSLSKI